MCRTNGVSDHWCVGPLVCRTNGVSDQWSVTIVKHSGLPSIRLNQFSDLELVLYGMMNVEINDLNLLMHSLGLDIYQEETIDVPFWIEGRCRGLQ